MVSWAMPLLPVTMRSPGSTAVPRAGVERCPPALVSVTSPVTKVNSPLALQAACDASAARQAAQSCFSRGAARRVMVRLLDSEHFATDRGRDLVAVVVVDVDVGAVLGEHVLQAQRAALAEL